MITFIVTYDLADTQPHPDANEIFKKELFTIFNGLSLKGQEFQKTSSIQSIRDKEEGYDLPNSTFLINVHYDYLTPDNIANYIFDIIKPLNIVIGKLYINAIDTNGRYAPFVLKNNKLFGGQI